MQKLHTSDFGLHQVICMLSYLSKFTSSSLSPGHSILFQIRKYKSEILSEGNKCLYALWHYLTCSPGKSLISLKIAHTHFCTHVSIHVCQCVRSYVCIYPSIYIHMRVSLYVCMQGYILYVLVYLCICACTCVNKYVHATAPCDCLI